MSLSSSIEETQKRKVHGDEMAATVFTSTPLLLPNMPYNTGLALRSKIKSEQSPESQVIHLANTNVLPPDDLSLDVIMRSCPSHLRQLDIILGRGAQYATNPGNRCFYEVIDNSIPSYEAAGTKHEKSQVVLSIFQRLSSLNCRFVRKNEEDGSFVVINDKDARQKISHALRYRKQNMLDSSFPDFMTKIKRSQRNKKDSRPQTPQICEISISLATKAARTTFENESSGQHEAFVEGYCAAIFTDAEMKSVLGETDQWPSSTAWFKFYTDRDEVEAEGRNKDLDILNLW